MAGDLNVLKASVWHPDDVLRVIQRCKEELWLFHFGGHANEHQLELEAGIAKAGGLAELLAACKELKLLVLNGCATYGQVEKLLDLGIAVVIATSAPIGDKRASLFARTFYQNLVEGDSIIEAFKMGRAAVNLQDENINWMRGFIQEESVEIKASWGIFYKEEKAAVLHERLPGIPIPEVYLSFSDRSSRMEKLISILDSRKDLKFHLPKDGAFRYKRNASWNEVHQNEIFIGFLNRDYMSSYQCMWDLHCIASFASWDSILFSQVSIFIFDVIISLSLMRFIR